MRDSFSQPRSRFNFLERTFLNFCHGDHVRLLCSTVECLSKPQNLTWQGGIGFLRSNAYLLSRYVTAAVPSRPWPLPTPPPHGNRGREPFALLCCRSSTVVSSSVCPPAPAPSPATVASSSSPLLHQTGLFSININPGQSQATLVIRSHGPDSTVHTPRIWRHFVCSAVSDSE